MPMKLKEGSYENIITNELQQDMNLATDNGLVCRKEDIDNAEAPSMLTEHISRIIDLWVILQDRMCPNPL